MQGSDVARGAPDIKAILEARELLSGLFPETPILTPRPSRGALPGSVRTLHLKAENLQVTGSFKIRGAYNRIARLSEPGGVIAASAGNHAQGVALAASMLSREATIVMPEETPLIKVERTGALGARVVLHGGSFEEALDHAVAMGRAEKLVFVHAYEDRDVIAGQGTIGLEIGDVLPDVDAILVPVGGGGLISGIALATKGKKGRAAIIGVQASGAAPTAALFRGGKGASAPLHKAETIADAIRFKEASAVTLPIIRQHVDEMLTVTDEEIAGAILWLMEEAKLVVEGAGAVGVAAVLAGRVPARYGTVAAVVSGGNIDLNLIARVVEQGLARGGRFLVVRCRIPDRPGKLFSMLAHLAQLRVNVLDVRHNRAGWRIPLGVVEVELLAETRNAEHAREIVTSLADAGFDVERVERG